jgi:glycosyltransferase involved in cell wall biosynthesis
MGAPQATLPRISVIVTCFNYGRFIADALESVAAQTYPNWECIVVDDASTDNSVAVIEQWLAAATDPRFRLVKNETNQGQIASIARGLATSDSEFVALLDADDFWFPEFLLRHVEAHLNRFGAVSLTCSDEVQVDAARRALTGGFNAQKLWQCQTKRAFVPISSRAIPHIVSGAPSWEGPTKTRAVFVKPDILAWHWTTTSAMMFRRSMLKLAIPKSPQSLSLYADIYLVPICHYFTGSIVLDEALGAYRRHGENNFSNLPVLGVPILRSATGGEMHFFDVHQMMLRHLLDQYEVFVSTFGKSVVRKLVRTLFGYLLGQGQPVDGRRIRAIIGRSRYYRDIIRIVFRRLRRRAPRVPTS